MKSYCTHMLCIVITGCSPQEQSHQYALTIAALEEKLLALVQKHQLLQKENEKLKELSRATGKTAPSSAHGSHTLTACRRAGPA